MDVDGQTLGFRAEPHTSIQLIQISRRKKENFCPVSVNSAVCTVYVSKVSRLPFRLLLPHLLSQYYPLFFIYSWITLPLFLLQGLWVSTWCVLPGPP